MRRTGWRREAQAHAASALLAACEIGTQTSAQAACRPPDDVVHLYDALQQLTAEMAALPGLADGADDALAEHLEQRTASLKALRCYYLAETYAALGETTKAKTLLSHARYLAERATLEAEACGDAQAVLYTFFRNFS